jgi:hypothetical protein
MLLFPFAMALSLKDGAVSLEKWEVSVFLTGVTDYDPSI